MGRGLGWGTHRGPCQPRPFCDSNLEGVVPGGISTCLGTATHGSPRAGLQPSKICSCATNPNHPNPGFDSACCHRRRVRKCPPSIPCRAASAFCLPSSRSITCQDRAPPRRRHSRASQQPSTNKPPPKVNSSGPNFPRQPFATTNCDNKEKSGAGWRVSFLRHQECHFI